MAKIIKGSELLKRLTIGTHPHDVAVDHHKPLFYTEAIFILNQLHIEINDDACPTAGTDGVRLILNEKWWTGLTPTQRKAILYHEMKHALLGHGLRRKHRDPITWNIACDMAINEEDMRLGHDLPPGGQTLPPELNTFIIPSPEEIYEWLITNQIDTTGMIMQGMGIDVLAPTSDGEKRARSNITKAWTLPVCPGMLAGHSNEVAKHIAPVVPGSDKNWRSILGHLMLNNVKSGSDWNQPSNRLLTSGIYTPRNVTKGVTHLLAAIDVSSSMPVDRVGRLVADVDSLRRSLLIETLEIITFNSAVQESVKRSLHEPLNWRPRVGGGTAFQPPHDYANRVQPTYMLILTDGRSGDPEHPFPRTVWLVYDSDKTPYPGQVLHVE